MGNLVYHYTRLNALNSIFKKDGVYLWATRHDYLDDPLEQAWAQEVVLKKIQEKENFKKLTPEETKMLLEEHPYVLSFCKDEDSRVMWRLYAENGMGAILVLNRNYLTEMAKKRTKEDPISKYDVFNDVFYANENNIDSQIEECLKNVDNKDFGEENENKWIHACAYIKHDDFQFEKEVRYSIIRSFSHIKVSPNNLTSSQCTMKRKEDNKDVLYRMRGEEPIPYLNVKINPLALKKIIIGYRVKNYDVVEDYVKKLLSAFGNTYKNVDIVPSSVLYKMKK